MGHSLNMLQHSLVAFLAIWLSRTMWVCCIIIGVLFLPTAMADEPLGASVATMACKHKQRL